MKPIRTMSATTGLILVGTLLVSATARAGLGDLDSSFGTGGRLVSGFGGGSRADVALQADGRIVVAGAAGSDFALMRFNPDGTLDASFSSDGRQTTDFGGSIDAATAVAVQSDGKIVAAGGSDGAFAIARYNADGTLDTGFGVNGRQRTHPGAGGSAWELAIQTNGRIVAAGSSGSDFALARYDADGSLDRTFSGDGLTTIDVGGSDGARGLAIQADGRLVAAGRSGSDFALARYNADGSLDRTFSADGVQRTDFGGDDDAMAVVIQADGKIVAGGTAILTDAGGYTQGGDFALARYASDGSLDPSFGVGGTRTTELNWSETGRALALQPDGGIVIAGEQSALGYPENGSWFALAHYGPDGALDSAAQLTVFLGDVEFGAYARADSVALGPDGKIVAAGVVSASTDGGFALARYHGGQPATGPVNSTRPAISGLATEGHTLTVTPGAWSGTTPISVTDHWQRCDSTGAPLSCRFIAGATGTTYTLGAADVGYTIRVHEEASNPWGLGAVDSAPTAVVTTRAGTIAGTVRVAKTGTALVGASVTCSNGSAATTTSLGSYSIPDVAPGSYRCTASAKRYRSSTRDVTVISNRLTTANFNLDRS